MIFVALSQRINHTLNLALSLYFYFCRIEILLDNAQSFLAIVCETPTDDQIKIAST